ncbi:EAL domain-containing protein (putative c-di-GMP-specific phosphodiesterase class I) [Vibrio crassostreae]|uniref:EAL domain-containing response regulator n=1 Tax=Vibrio crassostreae TaxID=246167 RepID=UPI000F468864|nr:EAL domain-containing response regulator [Vibrio crassostreae]ROO67533.1 EAL domain-containing protein (putative c-di-GMP-specific phosphodiesterase class I) [Vibrio crassostreae]ROP13106.1 EAL domain-containing protein (putative c-di-GMP-specific phosphodiesterase class I) [Vibrio crassostreae]ROQ87181.1 EAL domain-containing protein (putative c-di-GMP-specific phosphodiesterase class I) [Vibrio crassostreae]ROR88448.1 EAL domain-containing protein (putative c-di-GMP-specific phosphodiester
MMKSIELKRGVKKMDNIKILIVDDQPLQLHVLEWLMRDIGMTDVDSCLSGKEAIQRGAVNQYDLIFVDLNMPDIDGVELLVELNKIGYTGGIVVLSAVDASVLNTVGYLCHKLKFGFVQELSKPCQTNDLNKLLREFLNSRPKQGAVAELYSPSQLELQEAIGKGQLINHYQPQFDFNSSKLVGVEALVRWNHPEKGLIPPHVFLSQIEKFGMDKELFDAVLSNALTDISLGHITCSVSINVGQANIDSSHFSDHLLDSCQQFNVHPASLVIELTETNAYNDSINILKNLARLRLNRVGVSIDDFGTGYSSLIKLAHLPFTEMKIDRGFVTDCINDETKKTIIEATVNLAKNLNIQTVAEGIEDQNTWNLIHQFGVDICQGYFTGKPVPVEEITPLCAAIRKNNCDT